MRTTTVLGTFLLTTSAQVFAHSGDHSGSAVSSLAHLWTHPDHWLVGLGVLAVVAVAVLSLQRICRPASRDKREQ